MDHDDRFAIEDLLQRYTTAIDDKDWDLLDTVFTPDAVLDYTTSGGPEGPYPDVKAWLQQALAPFQMTQHMIGKSTFTVESADEVRCRSIFHNPMGALVNDAGDVDPNGSRLHIFFVGGWYNDTCRRTPDGWRIVAKHEEQGFFYGDLPSGFAIPE